jgi:succinate-semialdehyde dehydrogenase/glutarate-semialdehyde dehydrogenase
MADVLARAGLPDGLFTVVPGAGTELGTPLIDGVDHLTFTGSTATGRLVAEQCGRRLIACTAELGGKNPMIVLADADLRRAVDGAVWACFSGAGQLCVSIERVYVEDAVYEAFVDALVDRVRSMRLAAGFDWQAEMGTLISEEQLATVSAQVADAVEHGARVLAGGRERPDIGPYAYEPTVLEGVTDEMVLARSETFGPVVSVYRVRDEDEAVDRANDTSYGLNASVWSTPEHGRRVAARLRTGSVNVNEGYAAAWGSHGAPIGGMKESGLGRRHGAEGLLSYTEPLTIATQRLLPLGPIPRLDHELWARWLSRGVRAMRWIR